MSTIRVDEIKGQTPGLVTIDDNLQVSGGISYDYSSRVKTISSNYTIQPTDAETIYVDASGGAVTVTLPALSGNLGRRITVRAADATNTITVERAGSDTIVGLTSVTLSSVGDYWTVEAGPSRWELVDGWERGSNSNGEWERLPNGTLNQSSTGTYTDDCDNAYGSLFQCSNTMTFPIPFLAGSTPKVGSVGAQVNTGASWASVAGFPNETSWQMRVVDVVTSIAATIRYSYMATGRWYA